MTVCEILDAMEANGLSIYEKLPTWIELCVYHLISLHGIRTVATFVSERQMEEFEALVDTVRIAHNLHLDGCGPIKTWIYLVTTLDIFKSISSFVLIT